MKANLQEKTLKTLSKIALATAEKEVNSACFLFAYQPEIPKELQKAKKFKR